MAGTRLGLGLLLGLCLLIGSATLASAAEEQTWGYALAHELMSPFCPGRTLSACPSEKAAEVRQWILLQEAAGASREEVIASLQEQFGDVIHSSPDAEGWGLAAWLLPFVALLVGAGVVALVLRSMTGGGAGGSATAHSAPGAHAEGVAEASPASPARDTDPDDADLERIVDEELRASEM